MKPENLEDIYELAPLQQGMLFDSLIAPNSGVYFIQSTFSLEGQLDTAALEKAWQEVVNRHTALRTFFLWEELDNPLQVVQKDIEIPLNNLDWSSFSKDSCQSKFKTFLVEDRETGFDLSKPPLMRLTLIKMSEEIHRFIWSYHHLILDGWSTSLVLKEVFAVYDLLSSGQTIPLKRERPYRDYIVWLQQKEIEPVEAFWHEFLKGFEIPTSFGLNRVKGTAGQKQDFCEEVSLLSSEINDAIRSLAHHLHITPNTVLMGTWALLLSLYSGRDDVVFGTVVSGRRANLPGIESMIGLFINNLPMRVKFDLSNPVSSWLENIHQKQLEVQLYEFSPLSKIQNWSAVPRNIPLFDCYFNFENYFEDDSTAQLRDIVIRDKDVIESVSYPLTLSCQTPGRADAQLTLRLMYDRNLYDTATIRRLLVHYQVLLKGIIANPDAQLSKITVLTEAERQLMLVEWNNTTVHYPGNSTLQQLFEKQAELTPDTIAVKFENKMLTYKQLNEKANQLAHYLQVLGVGPDCLVGVFMERSLEMVISLYGILKAGGAYVPLDPEYPLDRISFMIKDTQLAIILTQTILLEKLPENSATEICLDSSWPVIANQSTENPAFTSTSEDLAYVIYTSGSTGKPKGVMNEHRGISNRLLWMQDNYGLTETDRILQKTPFSFDVSVWEFFWPLLFGARLVIAQPGGHKDASYLARLILEESITTIHFVPSMLQAFLRNETLKSCGSLTRVICSGEALSFDLQQRFFEQSQAELHNLYGPTEAAVDVTFWACDPENKLNFVPIGRPVANTQIYILNSNLEPVPVGISGILYIGGIQVARGYLNRPDLTAEKFVPDPFRNEPGARLYNTGDLAQFLSNGVIEYLGRDDNQVKIRGFRIELGEIEAALDQLNLFQSTVVVVREDKPGDKRLVAYLVGRKNKLPTVTELRQILLKNLPEYMVPAYFVMLDSLPLLPNGKLNRRALPAPDKSRPDLQNAYVAPRTKEEAILCDIWSEILHVKQVGIHDNFFELGGDSILSFQIISRANQSGIRFTPQELFQCQTIAALSVVADTPLHTSDEQGIITGSVPLTPIQIWFFEKELPEPNHWNQAITLEVSGHLNLDLLDEAFRELISHHDALRLGYFKQDSDWQQFLAAPGNNKFFDHVDISSLSDTEQEIAMTTIASDLQAGFDLSVGLLLRGITFERGRGKSDRLLIIIHHLAVDGISWRILLEDIETICHQLMHGRSVSLPPKTTSFKSWAIKLNEYSREDYVIKELDYWVDTTKTAIIDFPSKTPDIKANTEGSAMSVSVALERDETRSLLIDVPPVYNTQINDLLLTALAQSYWQWTGSRSLLLDLEGHGREQVIKNMNLSRTVGWFTTIFPVRLDIDKPQDNGNTIKSIKEQLRSIPQRGIGYGLLRYLRGDETIVRRLKALPQPAIIFNYLGQFNAASDNSALFRVVNGPVGSLRALSGRRGHLLEIDALIADGSLQIDWTFSRNLHQQEDIEKLANYYIDALRSLISHCLSSGAGGFTPSDFPESNLSQEELENLIADFDDSNEAKE